jgi:hypothetical protein
MSKNVSLSGLFLSLSSVMLATSCLAQESQPLDRRDLTKAIIELPVKSMLKSAAPAEGNAYVNRKVPPGLVHWNEDFTAACQRSKVSGKPVLLFHMMGNLDQEFT